MLVYVVCVCVCVTIIWYSRLALAVEFEHHANKYTYTKRVFKHIEIDEKFNVETFKFPNQYWKMCVSAKHDGLSEWWNGSVKLCDEYATTKKHLG